MTTAEMKKALKELGLADTDIAKVSKSIDAEKITKAVESSDNIEAAFKAIKALHPSIDIKQIKKQYEFYGEQLHSAKKEKKKKNAMELSESELELVAGGSAVGDWLSKNWKGIVIGVAIGVLLGGFGLNLHIIGVNASGALSTFISSTALAIPTAGMSLIGMGGIGSAAIMAGTIAAGAAAGGAVSHFIGD